MQFPAAGISACPDLLACVSDGQGQASYLRRCLVWVGLMLALPVWRDVATRREIVKLWDVGMTATFRQARNVR